MRVSADVMNVLTQCRALTNGYMMGLPNLTRPMYISVNTVLEAAGGKWSKKAKAHVFPTNAADIIDRILDSGEIEIPQDFGYFTSPPAVVERLLELAEIRKHHRCLEPSAGRGNIAYEIVKGIGARVDCVELLDANYAALAKMHSDKNLNGSVQQSDFLSVAATPIYDRIVMNPPFAKQADIQHVLHALKFLKPLGLLVSVMASGVMFRENRATVAFRELVAQRGGEFEPLPDDSFKVSCTNVNTVIVTIPGA